MKITIRVYRRSDPDIMGLCMIPGYDFPLEMYRVLCSYVRGEPCVVEYDFGFYHESKFPDLLQRHVILDPVADADVIEWLKMIRPMYRNNFLKNLFRSSFSYFPAHNYFRCEDDYKEFMDRIQKFKSPASAAEVSQTEQTTIKKGLLPTSEETDAVLLETEPVMKEAENNESGMDAGSSSDSEPAVNHKASYNVQSSPGAVDMESDTPDVLEEKNIADDFDNFDDLEAMMEQFN